MVNSYSNPVTYGATNNQNQYQDVTVKKKKNQAVPYAITTGAIGGGVGAIIGYKKNPFITSKGTATDGFTKSAYNKYSSMAGTAEKTLATERKDILKELDKIKNADDLKTLLNDKKTAAKDALGKSYDDIVNHLSDKTLSQNKSTIKTALKAQEETCLQKMKNWIADCWNKDNKKFEKAKNISDDVFESIESATKGAKWNMTGKYAAIGLVASGLLGYFAYNFVAHKKQAKQTQQG